MESKILSFAQKMEELLEIERQEEMEESANLLTKFSLKELEKRNLAITKLFVKEVATGIYGKILLHLQRQKSKQVKVADSEEKVTKFSPGDIVGLFQSDRTQQTDGNDRLEGIVYKVRNNEIVVAFKEMHDFDNLKQPISLVILANEVTFKRCKQAIENLKQYQTLNNQRLIEVLFEIQNPISQDNIEHFKNLKYFNQGINQYQAKAIEECLASTDVSLIHGPPGTGKTTTVVEFILQSVELQKAKVLACAPSNIAVDNIIERLALSNPKIKVVRIGHPARLSESVQQYCLDALISSSGDYQKQTNDIRREINKLGLKLKKAKTKTEKKDIYGEFKMLRKDLRQLEQKLINEIFSQANVICCTLTSAADKTLYRFIENKLQDKLFDLLVIDECAQSIEPACWIPLRFAKKIVMAGDHKQLDATVKSDEASRKGLSKSLFERVMDFNVKVSNLLNEQYRMNSLIMAWSNSAMYNGELVAHQSVKDRVMNDIYPSTDELLNKPLLLIETAGALMHEGIDENSENESKYNNGECDLVIQVLKELKSLGVKNPDIGVISPYNAQVNLIKKQIRHHYPEEQDILGRHPKIEVSTVDGFQGREKEIIIISMVRSNPKGEIGFLSNERRMNVAVTRAKRLCVLIGDSGTVGKNKFLGDLMTYFKENGSVRSAFDYQGEPDVRLMYGVASQQPQITSSDQQENNQTADEKKKDKKKKKDARKLDSKSKTGLNNQQQQSYKDFKKQHNQEENKEREISFQQQIDEFLKNQDAIVIEFPTTLNSWERQVIHSYCEQVGLNHESRGEGDNRQIIVSKKGQKTQKTQQDDDEDQGAQNDLEENEKQEETKEQQLNQDINGKKKKKTKKKQNQQQQPQQEESKQSQESQENGLQIQQNNRLLEYAQQKKQQEEHKKKKQEEKKKLNKEKQQKKVDTLSSKVAEMDDLEFLDSLIQENNTCMLHSCSTSIKLIYWQIFIDNFHKFSECKNCKKRFCALHFYPEKHDCEEESKHQDNEQIWGKGANKEILKSRAQQAIKDMESKRLAKPTKKQEQQQQQAKPKKK